LLHPGRISHYFELTVGQACGIIEIFC
jgi:hypothetical protein